MSYEFKYREAPGYVKGWWLEQDFVEYLAHIVYELDIDLFFRKN